MSAKNITTILTGVIMTVHQFPNRYTNALLLKGHYRLELMRQVHISGGLRQVPEHIQARFIFEEVFALLRNGKMIKLIERAKMWLWIFCSEITSPHLMKTVLNFSIALEKKYK